MSLRVRREEPGDTAAIRDVVSTAFGRDLEAGLVDELRADGDAAISLVAVDGPAVVGHLMLSPMAAPFRALGLGPVSVAPSMQRRGVGKQLITRAIEEARTGDWDAVFVLGDAAYYGVFGFDAETAAGFASPYAGPHFMVLALNGALRILEGPVDYAPAFRRFED